MFQLRQSILLFITAAIWGAGFIGQSIGMDHVSPFTFTFFRTLIGALCLLPLIAFMKHRQVKAIEKGGAWAPQKTAGRSVLIKGSICCGVCLIAAESFQQFGLVYTQASKAGFITSMYIIFVPLISLFLGKRPNLFVIIGVVLSVIGLYLLCVKQGTLTFEIGDLLILICAVIFAVHILVIAVFVEKVDGVMLSCGQFFVASFLGLIMMLIFESHLTMEALKAALPAILWCGIMSNGVAYTLQIVGQRGMNPTIATIILSLESVMAAVFGALILNESLSSREYTGCLIMLCAVIIAQLNPRLFFKGRE